MTFADVEFRILPKNATGYPVEITVQTETGRQEYLGGFLDPAGTPGVAAAGYADMQYGVNLFNWLFADPKLQKHWATIRGEHKQRRIRLRLAKEAPELHQYPWESLCEPDPDNQALRLAAAEATPFSRYLEGQWQPGQPISGRPVRMLVAIANPNGLAALNPPLVPIVTQTEWEALNQALQGVRGTTVELKLLPEPCTLQRLAEELRQGHHHILHLICHGTAQNPTPAVLYLADDNNEVVRVRDEELAEQLKLLLADSEVDDEQKLRLVFLASCQTARRSAYDAFHGVAPQLVAAGVPAVLAMQDNVGVEAAREFAKAFYLRLLEAGQADVAANQARRWLLTDAENANRLDIAIPALFLRLRDGRLFAEPQPTAARRRLQAPPPPATFAGRVEVLQRLSQALTSQPGAQVVVALQGIGGQGKSTVASVLGRDLEDTFPGGVLWVDVGPGATVGSGNGTAGDGAALASQQSSIVGRIALELGLDLKDVPRLVDRAAIVQSELAAGGRLLAILDDVWDPDLGRWLLNRVLPAQRAVLITTRLLDVARALGNPVERLGVLSEDEGADMLARFLGPLGRHEAAARQIVGLLEGLPLALELAARRCDEGAEDLPWLLGQLQSKPTLGVLTLPGQASRETSVEYTLSLSLQGLDADLVRRFRALGVFAPAPFDLPALAAVWQDESLDVAEEAARQLVRRALLGRGEERLPAGAAPAHPVYVQHALLRAYALALLQGTVTEPATAKQFLAFYQALPAHDIGPWQVVERFWPQMEHAWTYSLSEGPTRALQFHDALATYFRTGGRPQSELIWLSTLVASMTEAPLQKPELSSLLHRLGQVHHALDDVPKALERYREAWSLTANVGEQAMILSDLGRALRDLGNLQEALDALDQALVLARKALNRSCEADVLENMGRVFVAHQEMLRALACYQAAAAIRLEIGGIEEQSMLLQRIGDAYESLSQKRRALEYYDLALKLALQASNRWVERAVRHTLASLLERLNRLDQAEEHYSALIKLDEQLSHPSLKEDSAALAAIRSERQSGERTTPQRLLLEATDMQQLIRTITWTPFIDEGVRGRRAILWSAGLDEVLSDFDLSGASSGFAVDLVNALCRAGTLPDRPTYSALGALLDNLRGYRGAETRDFLARCILKYGLITDQDRLSEFPADILEAENPRTTPEPEQSSAAIKDSNLRSLVLQSGDRNALVYLLSKLAFEDIYSRRAVLRLAGLQFQLDAIDLDGPPAIVALNTILHCELQGTLGQLLYALTSLRGFEDRDLIANLVTKYDLVPDSSYWAGLGAKYNTRMTGQTGPTAEATQRPSSPDGWETPPAPEWTPEPYGRLNLTRDERQGLAGALASIGWYEDADKRLAHVRQAGLQDIVDTLDLTGSPLEAMNALILRLELADLRRQAPGTAIHALAALLLDDRFGPERLEMFAGLVAKYRLAPSTYLSEFTTRHGISATSLSIPQSAHASRLPSEADGRVQERAFQSVRRIPLSVEEKNRLVWTLANLPWFDDLPGRLALVHGGGLQPLVDHLDLSGAPLLAAMSLVMGLASAGTLPDRPAYHALGALLDGLLSDLAPIAADQRPFAAHMILKFRLVDDQIYLDDLRQRYLPDAVTDS